MLSALADTREFCGSGGRVKQKRASGSSRGEQQQWGEGKKRRPRALRPAAARHADSKTQRPRSSARRALDHPELEMIDLMRGTFS